MKKNKNKKKTIKQIMNRKWIKRENIKNRRKATKIRKKT